MNKFNPKDWSVAQCVQNRVQREDDAEWSQSTTSTQTPQFKPPRRSQGILKKSVGLWNFFRNSLLEFRP